MSAHTKSLTERKGKAQECKRAEGLPSLTPLVLAMLSAFPLHSLAQVAVARPVITAPRPAAAAVPRPMPGWRVGDPTAQLPVNKPNATGGIDQAINQKNQRDIYNWQSFDIGANSSVTFNFPGKDSSALNRVVGSTTPSQIFGMLRSQYANPDPGKAPLVGGSIYLINANGILFGKGSQVNVGSLIASTLNLKDSDFLSGLNNSIKSVDPTFTSTPSLFAGDRSFVLVDPGATINTANGGRVFLFAKNVQNAGSIGAPEGQVVLAAGGSVYLQDPTIEKLYASEVNPAFPTVKGLLVEVGGAAGSASNLASGLINTPTGNTTLVGMAVNQLGRVTASTSVTQNGSVFLLARGDTIGSGEGGGFSKRAKTSGSLTLGAGSSIEIAPDATLGLDGKALTSNGSAAFTTSRVELAGKAINIQSGASLVAHGGVVAARAEAVPGYGDQNSAGAYYAQFNGSDNARLIVDKNAVIDVSGTSTTEVSTARNFVTTQLLGKSDLKDAPLQKDGPLYRSKVSFDVRSAVPILGDTSSYINDIGRTVDERLAKGGSITLVSTGSLVTHADSVLNVSGGRVTYTDAQVIESRLVAADGSLYTLNQAPKDIVYSRIEGATKVTQDRWGIVPQYVPSQTLTGRLELGYVDGQAGGALTMAAPRTFVDGQLKAATFTGVRQTRGQDAVASGASISLGLSTNVQSGSQALARLGDENFATAGVRDIAVTKDRPVLADTFWTDPLAGSVLATSRVAAKTLEESGAGKFVITADAGLVIQPGAELTLAPKSSLDLASGGVDGINIAGSFRSEGGKLTAQTSKLRGAAVSGSTEGGSITLAPGASIDVSGRWANRALDGADTLAAASGGSVSLRSSRALVLEDASRIDVSGGATVASNGAVRGTSAGSISLEGNAGRTEVVQLSRMHIGADLRAQSLVGGGTLALKGMDSVTIATQAIPRGVKDGSTPGSLQLSEQFFRNGAFTNYDVQASRELTVLSGVKVAPQASNWILTPNASQIATGTKIASVLDQGELPDASRNAASVSLGAVTRFGNDAGGKLSVVEGAQISTDPLASVSLTAGRDIAVDGRIRSPGGKVNVELVANAGNANLPVAGSLVVGPKAVIDVSGTSLRQPQTGLLAQGRVIAGGSVKIGVGGLTARLSPVQVMAGAVVNADGVSDRLGVATTSASGATTIREQRVSSSGGSVTVSAQEGGAVLAGDMHARAGGEQASDGSFSLRLAGERTDDPPRNLISNYTIAVQQAPVLQMEPVAGRVLLSASGLQSGFSDVSLRSLDRIRFAGDVNFALAGNLLLDAPLITASPQSRQVSLTGAASILLGNTPVDSKNLPTATTPIAGSTALSLKGGLIEFYGSQGLQGYKSVEAKASSEIRLAGAAQLDATQNGRLSLQADLTLDAPQISVTSNSNFNIDANGQRVVLTGGDAASALPLSAGGAVTVNAREISAGSASDPSKIGVLRAPFGQIALNASERIDVNSGSVLTVSGAGSTVPFGITANGANWTYKSKSVTAPVAKTVSLVAKEVNVSAGATIDASGGGRVFATEFVAGPGGSTDVFAGASGGAFAVVPGIKEYAPQDTDTLAQKDASGSIASAQLGRQITVGAGAPLPAGTYSVLPARYALLDGAFLVRPVSAAAPLALGASLSKADGSVWVGGQLGQAGTGVSSSLTQSFQFLTSKQAQASSEIRQTDANSYFAAQAKNADAPVPRLPQDAGRINIEAQQLALKGTTLFKLPEAEAAKLGPLGGELDISSDRIRILGGTAAAPAAGVLALNAADLNATGASLLVIGGSRNADSNRINTVANEVILDNAGQPLKGADLLLVANQRLELKPGASLMADPGTGAGAASNPFNLLGDGALLRVSSDSSASTQRTGVNRVNGDVVIGAGASLQGGAVTVEATRATKIAADVSLNTIATTVAASRIAVGTPGKEPVADSTLLLTPTLAAQLSAGKSLTLRSFDGIDFYGSVSLGGESLRSLSLDTGSLRAAGPASNAVISAGGVTLANSSGSKAEVSAGTGQLKIVASGGSGANLGTGQIVIGPGSMASSGVAALALDAAAEVIVSGQTQLNVAGDLGIRATALQATQAANAALTATGRVAIVNNGRESNAKPGAGAHLAINGASIEQGGRVVLPSGEVTLNASKGDVNFASGSSLDVAGRNTSFDGVAVAGSGGDLRAAAAQGNVRIDKAALLDVSAAPVLGGAGGGRGGGGSAGSLELAAPTGGVTIAGRLRGVAGGGQGGASLSVDSAAATELATLSTTLAAEPANFKESISVRNRSGDQQLRSGGPGLASRHITISADQGSLAIGGVLDAGGASAPTVLLAAGSTLSLNEGATVSARSTGGVGGEVQLMAGKVAQAADGSFQSNGQVLLSGGTIDTAAASGGVDGTLLIRTQRNQAGTDVRLSKAAGSTGTKVTGAKRVEVEAVKQYATDTVDDAFIAQVNADNTGFGANASAIRGRMGSVFANPLEPQLRAGVEVLQSDPGIDLTMTGDPANNGWNLTRFNALGQALAQPTGAPVNLTLRAAGNLNVQASISDGFMPAGVVPTNAAVASKITPSAVIAQAGGNALEGGRIRLVGGADLSAANVMATMASADSGDVNIGNGNDVMVRSTTGSIQIAAGRDVTLTDHQTVVYTTGTPVNGPGYVGLTAQRNSLLSSGSTPQSPTLTGGGSVSVSAARDVVGAGQIDSGGQFGSEWLWRGLDATSNGQATWWARYDKFQQGFATFGGGSTSVAAGRDALYVEASAASNGYIARDAAGNPSGLKRQGGGDVSVLANRDIVGGFVLQDVGKLTVRAGRDITSPVDAPALQVLHGVSQVEIEARNDATTGLVTAFGLISGSVQGFGSAVNTSLTGAAAGASLRMLSAAGNLDYLSAPVNESGSTLLEHDDSKTGIDRIIPESALFAAPGGNLSVGNVTQVSGGNTQLNLFGEFNAKVGDVSVRGTDLRQASPSLITVQDSLGSTISGRNIGDRNPVRVVADKGDLTLAEITSAKPARLLAGRDLTSTRAVDIQHQADDDLSMVRAGRDFSITAIPGLTEASFKVQGPGELLAIAGRDIKLNTSGGFGSLGNREVTSLPDRSARSTLLAGVSLGSSDYARASASYFELLGGTGVAAYAPDLAAQLAALQASQPVPAPGLGAAAAFKAAPIAEQLAQARKLVGVDNFSAAVLADAQRRVDVGKTVDLATATKSFDALADADKAKVMAAALSIAWAKLVPLTQQRDTVLAIANARGLDKTNSDALIKFVKVQTGQSGLDLRQSVAALQSMAPERRLLFTNQVLLTEIRDAGRAASALSGSARETAYARAYDALAVVFPDAGTDGSLQMGSSQVRTYQGSAVNILTPRGSVNVGELASAGSNKSASSLGIVTGAGGDILIAVRDNVDVNQSRVFTVGKGDLLMWASQGNLDAGRGAKTVTGAPPPVFRFDSQGNFVIDTSGSFSGSGIAVLDANSTLDLYAPKGEINAGDAGIKSLGNAFLGAARFVGADNLAVGGVAVGAPPPASTGGETAGVAAAGQASSTTATRINPEDSEEEKERKRRKRLNLILDFLGFGDPSNKP
jgi:filamentous hemagglutinin family protein